MITSRAWAMPNADTFSIKPIGAFVRRYLAESKVSVDPFARNCTLAMHTNDLNPATVAQHHMDAEQYLILEAPICDLLLFDPPYSPRQISECYAGMGRKATKQDTHSGWYTKLRNAAHLIVQPKGIVLSFGWNSNGMGKTRGYELLEILLVAHGGAHNDTICISERRLEP